jgi:hypothetical protein
MHHGDMHASELSSRPGMTGQCSHPVHGTGRPLLEEKIMEQEVRIKTEVTKENYGNVLLSFLMGIASVTGIWYLSSVLIALARYYS